MNKINTVVVTYNRLELLKECVASLQSQTHPIARIFVINNASSDGTKIYLDSLLREYPSQITAVHLAENTGGAGGFSEGLRLSIADGADWTWMMDDDACPRPSALEELLTVAQDPTNIYGSLPINGSNTSWATTLIDEGRIAHFAEDVPSSARVESIPLLGFLIHRSLVLKIGYPDAEFFIAADDIEYCMRARQAGANIIIAGNSLIEHPRTLLTEINLFSTRVAYLSLSPWKRYYDTRNRLLIARKYYGAKLFTQTIPGTFVRMIAALMKEPSKLSQLKAFSAGFIDGLLGRKGRRHEKWGIK